MSSVIYFFIVRIFGVSVSFNGVNVHLSSQIATLIRYNDLELTSDHSNNLST